MTSSNVYLFFDGNCRTAMTFYGACFAASSDLTPYEDSPDRVLHAELHSGPFVLMASDVPAGTPLQHGTNFSISIGCDSHDEMDRLFAALTENGRISLPPHDAFWGGRFTMFTDQFGVGWMLSYRA